jgi:two-component system response regulator DesR
MDRLIESRLSPREKDVVGHLIQGKTNNEIGRALFLSQGTIKQHMSSAMAKTGATNRTHLALICAGFIEAPLLERSVAS